MKIVVKGLLLVLFIGCLFHMPYGFYQFFRIAAFVLFGWLAYNAFERDKKVSIDCIIYILCALLFNPFIKIHFSRGYWQKIDLAFIIALGVWIIIETIISMKKVAKRA
ncbi:hypothetical protein A4D02_13845 [Niastella koreensis]|uniref:Transmembrane protein n=2 Tax=Niastella koreensis TaxID=354356 RepID=G8TQ37_NIAKG|nr:DUF6804 family protein [Niastella koreensis]AEW01038.1 hypothetical protein Niako_4787 [Niastella koreensis GR20-10]OQP42642.1 hypothetical protein A4D02_13845 [Niastella koreensis]